MSSHGSDMAQSETHGEVKPMEGQRPSDAVILSDGDAQMDGDEDM